jgi:fructose-bisphosphate aldolase class I
LRSRGIHCGIKVDAVLVVIGGTKDEIANTRLNGLGKRCIEYYEKGWRFEKLNKTKSKFSL